MSVLVESHSINGIPSIKPPFHFFDEFGGVEMVDTIFLNAEVNLKELWRQFPYTAAKFTHY